MYHFKLENVIFVTLCIALPLSALAESGNFRARAHQVELTADTEEDVEAEIRFGQTISARILGQFRTLNNTKLNKYVNLVGKSLALNSSRDDIQFHFTVLDLDFINAYSAPGGYIFITKGAIYAMQDEAELASVLAHEIAHITEKHIVKEFKIKGKEKGAAAGMSRLLGSAQSSSQALFSQAVDNAVIQLLNKGFKQEDEYASDQIALLLLANTGYDPLALPRFLTRLMAKTEKQPKQSNKHKPTHPPTSKRLETIQTIIKLEGLQNLNFPRAKTRFDRNVKK